MFLINLFDAGIAYDTPALFNRGIDRNHRSFLSAVEGAQLGTFHPRTSREWLRVDLRHVPWYAYVHISTQLCFVLYLCLKFALYRLRAAGLLPLCRLVEAAADDRDPAKWWNADRSLLAALVDRWRPETHTFHLPCGEVAPTLQDVSYLLGLPLAGDAVGPVTTAVDWQDDLTARFALVQRTPHLPLKPLAHHRNTGPTKRWLLQFTVSVFVPK